MGDTNNKLDQIINALGNFRIEFTNELKRETQNLNSKLDKITENQTNIEKKQNYLEQKIKFIEKTFKRRNIVIYNMKEIETDNKSLQKYVLEFFNSILGVKTEIFELDFVRRLGKKADKTRPILVGLISQIKKDDIMKNKFKLRHYKDEIIYIKDDLMKEDLNLNSIIKENEKTHPETTLNKTANKTQENKTKSKKKNI